MSIFRRWLNSWFHRCSGLSLIEVLDRELRYSVHGNVALIQMKCGVVEVRELCKVRCDECGRVFLSDRVRIVKGVFLR